MGDPQPAVVNNAGSKRFELSVSGQTAVLEYEVAGDRLRLVHTEVPPELRGHKYAEALTRAALEYAKSEHLRVVPICPYVRAYLTRHPEYASQ